MQATSIHGIFALTVATLGLLSGCAPEDGGSMVGDGGTSSSTWALAARGSHPVGFTQLPAEAPSAPRVKAWYPARAGEAPELIDYQTEVRIVGLLEGPLTVHGAAVRDAKPETGERFPLVVLSHGFGLSPEWYHGTAEHLASHGYVVLAPEHDVDGDWAETVLSASVTRPADVSAVIDLAEVGPLAAITDTQHVAVLGHSYGGYTALATAGARIDLDGLRTRCADVDDPFMAAYFCDPFVEADASLSALFSLDDVPEGSFPSLGDSRVSAVVAMAGDAYAFGEAGLRGVEVPALLLGGTADAGTPWDWGPQLAFDGLVDADRTLVGLQGAGHFAFTAPCEDMPALSELPPEMFAYLCEDPAWDNAEALDLTHHLLVAFLRTHLGGDGSASTQLDPQLYAEVDGLEVSWAGR